MNLTFIKNYINSGYKEKLNKFINIIKNDNKFVFWVKVSSTLFKLDEDVLIGVVYIPPEFTSYSSQEAFNDIDFNIRKFSRSYKYISLAGDCNARTAELKDFSVFTENDFPSGGEYLLENYISFLTDSNLPLNRKDIDKEKNKFGKLLINLCKGQNLFIMNGRVGSDSNIGELTCRNASAVDYFICSPNFIKCIDDLTVLDFSKCFSDVHTPLSITFESNVFEDSDSDINALDNTEHIVKIKKWENEKLHEFRGNFNRQAISDLRNKLRDLDASSVTQEQVNIVVTEFGKIHIDSAKETFGTITKSNNRKKKRNTKIQKPWFDLDCKFERQYYRKMKRKHKFRNSDNSRKELKEAEKKYKKQMDTSIRKYRQKMKKELKTLRSKNPKEYWKILNKGQKKKQPNISIDVLYEFFKNLNGAPDHDDVELSVLSDSLQENLDFDNLNIHLNDSITRDEILTCIKKLKNDKASGDDMIRKEFIKSTPDMFLALYVDLFNLIFNSGKIPNTWLAGNIVPFYKNKGAKTDPKNFRPITILSCFGKLFTSVLNNRLNTFSDEFLLLNENQTGFRKKYSTLDNTFVIYGLFELLKLKKKKLFCAFIDFEKAFDTVWRDGLWYKLLMCNIKGKMYNVILNLII